MVGGWVRKGNWSIRILRFWTKVLFFFFCHSLSTPPPSEAQSLSLSATFLYLAGMPPKVCLYVSTVFISLINLGKHNFVNATSIFLSDSLPASWGQGKHDVLNPYFSVLKPWQAGWTIVTLSPSLLWCVECMICNLYVNCINLI